MSGVTDLDTLLKSMSPELHEAEFVFCTVQVLPVKANSHISLARRVNAHTTKNCCTESWIIV